jgi:hypothetical protein
MTPNRRVTWQAVRLAMNWSRWLVVSTCYILVVMSVMGLEAFRPLIKSWPWGEDAFTALAIAVLPPACLLAIGLLATSTGAPRGVKGKPDHKVEEAPPRTPAQEKGHRLGIFITVISALILVFGLGAESNRVAGLGFMGVLFGYWLARLWYWFRSA